MAVMAKVIMSDMIPDIDMANIRFAYFESIFIVFGIGLALKLSMGLPCH